RAYSDTPRLVLVSQTVVRDQTSNAAGAQLEVDILRNQARATPSPGQLLDGSRVFRSERGLIDKALESQLLDPTDGTSLAAGIQTASGFGLYSSALAAGNPLLLVDRTNLTLLDEGQFSLDVKARITRSALDGKSIFVPAGPAVIAGVPRVGWM